MEQALKISEIGPTLSCRWKRNILEAKREQAEKADQIGWMGVIDSEWRGHHLNIYEHEGRQKTGSQVIHCLDVPEALAECEHSLAYIGLAVSR